MTQAVEVPAPAAAAADDALVQRHYPWVRAAAMRRVRNAHLADDVAQAVFIVLMRKKPAFNSEAALSAWLFQTMRYAAAHALRSQRRRAYHEARAATEMRTTETASRDEWDDIAPLLDESVARLRQDDRQAVLLRFYQQKTFGDVGAAMGISEEAARKRVDRAVDKLRDALTRRGVTVPAATALVTTLMTHAASTLPVAPIITTAAGTTAAGQIAKGIAMTWTPAKIAAVTIAALLALPVVATVGYFALGTRAQPAAQPAAKPAQIAVQAKPVAQADPVIPNDLLSISITDLVGPGIETIKQTRVAPDSNVSLPLVGPVNFKGMTLNQAELAVQKAYRDQNLIANAQIRITRVESGNSPSMPWARIGVGEYLHIEIIDLIGPGLVTTVTPKVPSSGEVSLPQAGTIQAAGLSPVELERAIQARYRQKNLLPNAWIHVERITEAQAKAQPPATQPRRPRSTAPN